MYYKMESSYFLDGQYYSKQDLLTMIHYYKQHHIDIPQDTWYNILLNTDVNQIKKSCTTNQMTNKICHDKQFLFDYWSHQGIPKSVFDLPQTQSDWHKLYKITDIVDFLVKLFLSEYQTKKWWTDMIIDFDEYTDFNVIQLLPELTKEINQFEKDINNIIINLDQEEQRYVDRNLYIRLFEHDNDIILVYDYEDGDGETIDAITQELTMDMLVDFLIRLFYYYPLITLCDRHGWSYTSSSSIEHRGGMNDIGYKMRAQLLKQHNIESKVLSLY